MSTRTWNPVALTRDCEAITVPHGDRVALTAGGEVEIVQRLGASATVRTQMGTLMRIEGADLDALGLEPVRGTAVRVSTDKGEFDPDAVLHALRGVYDPEIPVNIVDLGLVYRCDHHELDDGLRRVEIDMTMTAPGCGMGEVLRSEAEQAVAALPGVAEVVVEVVWDPPWSRDRISDAARLELGLF